MAFARDVYTAAGGQTDFTISFPYQEQEDVRVYQNGSLVDTADYTFPNATTVRLDTGATASDTIVLQRYTSQDTRDVDFTAGPLTESDLDNSAIQTFYMAQEAIDIANESLGKDSAELWDAESTRIVNVGSPTAGTDAVTKDYADALATGALGSPISIANGGTAATTAAAALTNLGAVPVGTNPATGVSYDNGTSGLTATDAQAAIDEVLGNTSSQVQAEAGTDSTTFMTPERAAQALVAQAPASAQIMTFSGDSELTITPNVVDGMYRITGALRPSVDQFIYLQTSDDGGVNFLDTAGDTFTTAWYERSASTFSSLDYPNEPGFRLKITGGGSTAEESAFFQALLWFNGSGRIACAVSGPSFDTSGFLYTHYANGISQTGAPHATGINRIRIKTSTGTATGTVIVENLRLS